MGKKKLGSWNFTIARYSERHGIAVERNVCRGVSLETAKGLIEKYKNRPVYIWHDNASEIDPMGFAMATTAKYERVRRMYRD